MTFYAARSLRINHALTPFLQFRARHNLANFTTSKQTLNNSVMQPRFSEGQDESKMMAELRALVENGWKLDAEQIGVQKTYHFNVYTKVLVGDSPVCYCLANFSGSSSWYRGEKQIENLSPRNDYCKFQTLPAISR